MKYEKLLSEGKIGNMTLKNRVVMAALETGLADFSGVPTRQYINYYEERAKNGVGLIITGITRVNDLHGAGVPRQLSMSQDRNIEPFARLVERMHAHGTKIMCQLHHPGRQNLSPMVLFWPMLLAVGRIWPGFWRIFPKMVPAFRWFMEHIWGPRVAAPSAIPCGHLKQRTRALSKNEIKKLVGDFRAAAVRVKKAGADGVEIHASHGYLIQQFLSPRTNKRNDEYGGSLENRMRFLLEIIKEVRAACGPEFPIVVRLTVDEYYRKINETDDEGIVLEEGLKMARALEKAGIDAIDVSSGTYETMNWWLEPTTFEPGWRKNLAREVKKNVSIPVIAANLIRTPEQAEAQLQEGSQDFVALGRPLVAEPEWVAKAREGRARDIKRCVCCLYCFESLNINAAKGQPLQCTLNPSVGREEEIAALKKDGNGRIAAVIGAGPAGLAAAEVLARRGFRTLVYERGSRAGGQLNLANKPPAKDKINWIIQDLEQAALRYGAEIRYNAEVDLDEIEKLKPHAVLLATGARPLVPPIKGADQEHVVIYDKILNGEVEIKNSKVTVIGSGMTGLETAEMLAENGNAVTVVEMLDELGPGIYRQHLDDILLRMERYKPRYYVGHKLEEIKKRAILIREMKTGKLIEQPAERLVLALGSRSENELAEALRKRFERVFVIGDAARIGRIVNAVHDGFNAALYL